MTALAIVAAAVLLLAWLNRGRARDTSIVWCGRIGAYHPATSRCHFDHRGHPGIATVGADPTGGQS